MRGDSTAVRPRLRFSPLQGRHIKPPAVLPVISIPVLWAFRALNVLGLLDFFWTFNFFRTLGFLRSFKLFRPFRFFRALDFLGLFRGLRPFGFFGSFRLFR